MCVMREGGGSHQYNDRVTAVTPAEHPSPEPCDHLSPEPCHHPSPEPRSSISIHLYANTIKTLKCDAVCYEGVCMAAKMHGSYNSL